MPAYTAARLLALALLAPASALAQATPPTPPAPDAAATTPSTTPPTTPDTVLARVNGQAVRMADIEETIHGLPERVRALPTAELVPLVLERQIDYLALIDAAKKQNMQNDPNLQKQMARAADTVLQNAYLAQKVGPKITDATLHAQYDAEFSGKTGEPEVHAFHILVKSEADAKKIIAELKKGADFGDEAKKYGTDETGKSGGDLNWLKKTDVVAPFGDAAFALKPGEITQSPVKTEFGWHVIKAVGFRTAPPPTFEEVRDALRQQVIQTAVKEVVGQARAGVTVEEFNPDGTKKDPVAAPASAPSAPATPGPATSPATPK